MGYVIAKEPMNHQNVHYSYMVNGGKFNGIGHAGIGTPSFGSLKVGDKVSVVYLPTDPNISCLGEVEEQFRNETTVIFLAALLLGMGLLYAVVRYIK